MGAGYPLGLGERYRFAGVALRVLRIDLHALGANRLENIEALAQTERVVIEPVEQCFERVVRDARIAERQFAQPGARRVRVGNGGALVKQKFTVQHVDSSRVADTRRCQACGGTHPSCSVRTPRDRHHRHARYRSRDMTLAY